jgi:hypothetical protein
MMTWLRRLFWVTPEDRWRWDFPFVLAAILLASWIGRRYDSIAAALGAAVTLILVRDLAFFLVVKPRRAREPERLAKKPSNEID